MRKFLLACLFLLLTCYGAIFAQNKTLGVGVATPNPNAALHVESPTNNQGFILPRLTTTQRQAMSSLLTIADKGLMLYDTDRSSLFIWDGVSWKSSSEFSVADTMSTSSVINVLNKGLGNAGKFKNDNRRSKAVVLWAETNSDSALSAPVYGLNSGTGDVAASFRIANSANKFPALYSESLGSGGVARFINNGTGSSTVFSQVNKTGHAYWAQHEGTSGYAAILQSVNESNPTPAVFVEAVGTGHSLFVQKSLDASTGNVIFSEHYGTSGHAGQFIVHNTMNPSPAILSSSKGTGPGIQAENNGSADGIAALFFTTDPANTYPAIQASTAGIGPGLRVMQTTGPGTGIDINMQNATSSAQGLGVGMDGLGSAASFVVNNSASNASAVFLNNIGLGDGGFFQLDNASSTNTAVKGRAINTGGGAGAFEVFNATNPYTALYANTSGTGSAGDFSINNVSSGSAALRSSTAGTGAAFQATTATGFTAIYGRREGASNGNAGLFEIVDAANTYPALQVNNSGTGPTINAQHSGATGDAIYAEHRGATGGSAGNFRISNTGNTASSLFAATNAPGGTAVGASNDADGVAFAIWRGGVKITVLDVSTAVIPTRASAYRVIGTEINFSLGFTPTDGEVFMIYNETTNAITFTASGLNNTIAAGEGKTFIVFPGGAIRGF